MLPVMVFDMDDTLYLERDFVRSGFEAVGAWVSRETGRRNFGPACQALFDMGHRTCIFDTALATLEVPAEPGLIDLLVKIYRTHEPDIALAADAGAYLRSRPARFAGSLITDGLHRTQESKVRALGLEDLLEFIVYTDALGKGYAKPHPRAFELVEAWAPPTECPLVYVADNPAKDFVTPRARGWWTVQVARPERVHFTTAPDARHEPHACIESLDELDDCLAWLGGGPPRANIVDRSGDRSGKSQRQSEGARPRRTSRVAAVAPGSGLS